MYGIEPNRTQPNPNAIHPPSFVLGPLALLGERGEETGTELPPRVIQDQKVGGREDLTVR